MMDGRAAALRHWSTAALWHCSTAALFVCLLLSPTLSAFVLMSVEEESRWGREAQEAMRKDVPRVSDPAIEQYVAGIGRRLAAVREVRSTDTPSRSATMQS